MINLTPHPATPELLEAGVIEISSEDRAALCEQLSFANLPSHHELECRAHQILSILISAIEDIDEHVGPNVMIEGEVYLMIEVAQVMRQAGWRPHYAFYPVEIEDDGARSHGERRFGGFIPA